MKFSGAPLGSFCPNKADTYSPLNLFPAMMHQKFLCKKYFIFILLMPCSLNSSDCSILIFRITQSIS